ncbi:bifunctional hydroxymethylpyrimidine kinase/phosphomethylpyrimidine kinase [Schaalia sp. Marseille-Q2122]|uniref:bifunctional hydroxymethylpyrimidine kinase/phosphomethylpyrimidine kinase n=1 Tax=Schaalia sp. Marseille-Q2122 TaxID=2736604 RepID=UPI00158CB53F|nr:bifunctional hydroxymethylpyrimidine kinase/phosphomethylpyrimidine kinase [Schaalia sp. Marseille-Q2122]
MSIPRVLSIAGSDPSGGAGIQADLKAMSACGAYAMTVITALTAQSTKGVMGVHAVPVDFVRAQLDTLLDDITPDATKVGMLASRDLAQAVGEYLPRLTNVVLDPVMVATSGDPLLAPDAIEAVRELCTQVDLITPNMAEAAVLLDCAVATTPDDLCDQDQALLDLGVRRVIVKGGHLDDVATDVYADADGISLITSARVATCNTHGTGCSLSSAIAALRPASPSWYEAVARAKRYLTGAIGAVDSLDLGHGHGPVQHFYELWSAAQNAEATTLAFPEIAPRTFR